MTSQPIGPQHTPTEWTARLASLVAAIRTDWDETEIRAALRKLADRPLIDVAAAALAACRRLDERKPIIDRTEPGIVTYCEHNEPGSRCPTCHPRTHHGRGPTPEQRAAMRAAIEAAKQTTKERERR